MRDWPLWDKLAALTSKSEDEGASGDQQGSHVARQGHDTSLLLFSFSLDKFDVRVTDLF